ncbi:MAG: hypothetical protein MI755_18180 [Sphingomonadales bacterium]|nr:hypothetical protein [Sphingomonadales bacterium]
MDEEALEDLLKRVSEAIADEKLRARIQSYFSPIREKTLMWEYGDNEACQAWVFADMRERKVVAAYCAQGHGALGSPWGIILKDGNHFGPDSAWYPQFVDLFVEWFAGTDAK